MQNKLISRIKKEIFLLFNYKKGYIEEIDGDIMMCRLHENYQLDDYWCLRAKFHIKHTNTAECKKHILFFTYFDTHSMWKLLQATTRYI